MAIYFFEKSLKLGSGLEFHLQGLRLQTLSVIRVSCHIFLAHCPYETFFKRNCFIVGFKPPSKQHAGCAPKLSRHLVNINLIFTSLKNESPVPPTTLSPKALYHSNPAQVGPYENLSRLVLLTYLVY